MRRLFTVLFTLWITAAVSEAAITASVHACKASTDSNTAVTAARDTTGATLLVLVIANSHATTTITPTDLCNGGACSPLNTWTCLTEQDGAVLRTKICYVLNPTTDAVHTFTATKTGGFPGLCMHAFAGTALAAGFDQQSGNNNNAGGTTHQPGNVVPSVGGEVVVNGIGLTDTMAPTIDAPFTPIADNAVASAFSEGVAIAYEIQTTATTRNPTWTFGAAVASGVVQATFEAPAAAAFTLTGPLTGVGK